MTGSAVGQWLRKKGRWIYLERNRLRLWLGFEIVWGLRNPVHLHGTLCGLLGLAYHCGDNRLDGITGRKGQAARGTLGPARTQQIPHM